MSDLPDGWCWVEAGEVAEVQGGIQKQPKRRPAVNPYPFLRVANVMRGRLDLTEVHEVELFAGEIERYRLQSGDLLVVEGNGSPTQIGRSARWRGEIQDCVHQNHLIRVRPDEAVDPAYLDYFWNSPKTVEYLRSVASSTSGLYVLTTTKVKQVSVPLAPVPEQLRIVAAIEEHFSHLDAALESLERARRNLRRMRAAVLQEAVRGNWPEARLGDLLVDIEAGKSFKTEGRQARDGEWGVIKVSAMTWGRFLEDENKAIPAGREIDHRHEIWPGDLLFSRANTTEYVGASVLVGPCRKRLLLSDKSMRLIPHPEVDRRWLWRALSSPHMRAQISAVATGTSDSMRNISQAKVRSLLLPLPPLDEQSRIADEVDSALSVIESIQKVIDDSSRRSLSLRRSILNEAFAGRLVPQDPTDEPASAVLERVAGNRHADVRKRRTSRSNS